MTITVPFLSKLTSILQDMRKSSALITATPHHPINTTNFICEEEVQTKSQDADRLTLKIKEENISLFFDGYPSQKELLDRLSENENFKAMIRQLKPWGDNTLLIRVMTLSDSANGVLAEIPLMIVYKEDF